jgi:signal transduction histidine kinase
MSKLMDYALLPPKRAIVAMALLLTGLIGVADYATIHQLSLSPFYLIPICWACWAAGRRTGLLLAAASALIWFVADMATGHPHSNRTVVYWNALMLLVLFSGVVFLLAAFQAASEHLEKTVQLRTAALQQEMAERKRLEQAKLQAERLAAVGTMAAQMAHEVRNPLGSITLNLDLVDKEVAKLSEISGHSAEEASLLVREMRSEVRRIKQVVEDSLQFVRPPKPNRHPLAVNALLEQKLASMLGTFEQARVKLRTEFDPALVAVDADADQIWEAVLNLIRNSLEAMPAGGDLLVSTRREGKQALVRVTDSGAGISPDQLALVFRPFFTTKAEGTGLGLALAQQIAIEHGGYVECDSVERRGSTFTISLPLTSGS